MKLFKKNIVTGLIIVIFTIILSLPLILPAISIAQQNPPPGKLVNPLGTNGPQSIPLFIKQVLDGVMTIGIPVVALAIIYCGFLFVTARGKSEAITKAKDALIYTLLGAGILLGAWAIANLIVDVIKDLK